MNPENVSDAPESTSPAEIYAKWFTQNIGKLGDQTVAKIHRLIEAEVEARKRHDGTHSNVVRTADPVRYTNDGQPVYGYEITIDRDRPCSVFMKRDVAVLWMERLDALITDMRDAAHRDRSKWTP